MVSPDVQMIHAETGKIFFNGKIYDVTRMAAGWVLSRPNHFEPLYTGESVDECCTWLMAMKV